MPSRTRTRTRRRRRGGMSTRRMAQIAFNSTDHETKRIETESNTFADLDGSFELLNGVAEGTGDDQRIGHDAKFQRLRLNLRMFNAGAATIVRVAVISVKDTNGNAPIIADFLQSAMDPVLSGWTIDSRRLFRVHYDRKFSFTNATNVKFLNKTIKLSLMTRYIGVGMAVGQVLVNGLFLFIWADNIPPNQDMSININHRLEWVG